MGRGVQAGAVALTETWIRLDPSLEPRRRGGEPRGGDQDLPEAPRGFPREPAAGRPGPFPHRDVLRETGPERSPKSLSNSYPGLRRTKKIRRSSPGSAFASKNGSRKN